MRALFPRGQLSDVASLRNPLTFGTTANGIHLLLHFLGRIGRDTRKPDIGRNAETDTDRYEIRNGTPDRWCRILAILRIVYRAFHRGAFSPRRIFTAPHFHRDQGDSHRWYSKVSLLLDIRWPGGAFWTNIRRAWSRIQRDFSAETVGQ